MGLNTIERRGSRTRGSSGSKEELARREGEGDAERVERDREREREAANTAWTNNGRERTTRMTDRWSTKCAQRARASPLYTLELAPVLAQIGLLSFVHSAPWFPTGEPRAPIVPRIGAPLFRIESKSSHARTASILSSLLRAWIASDGWRLGRLILEHVWRRLEGILTYIPWAIVNDATWQETG